jgi:hypothetical protein
MKTITYRGGLITFQIPTDWIEEYEENGGGTFYEDSPESGTLRLNVLTIKEKENSVKNLVNDIRTSISIKDTIEITNEYDSFDADRIIQSISRVHENDIPITIYRFDCVHKTNQSDYLIATFTWTIKSEFEKLNNYSKDLEMIRNNIEILNFGR